MTVPENIVRFKAMAGRVLGRLYDTLPSSQPFDPKTFEDEPLDDAELFNDTVMYLAENGFLNRVENGGYLRLSAKSYETLNQPDPLAPEKTLGAALAVWARATASGAGKNVIDKSIDTALQLLAAAIGRNS